MKIEQTKICKESVVEYFKSSWNLPRQTIKIISTTEFDLGHYISVFVVYENVPFKMAIMFQTLNYNGDRITFLYRATTLRFIVTKT